MPRKQKQKKRSKSKTKKTGRKGIKRPYKLDKLSRARHRHRKRRHAASQVHGHHKRMRDEAELTNYLLHQVLKTAASTDADPYNFNPRHYSRDPEYKYSSSKMREFKRGVPASDTNFWRPQGKDMPPSRGNFPGWQPQWAHTYQHPHAPEHGYPWHYNDPAGDEIYDHLV
jgi:hypothetical protein